jgi:hypothetical protein
MIHDRAALMIGCQCCCASADCLHCWHPGMQGFPKRPRCISKCARTRCPRHLPRCIISKVGCVDAPNAGSCWTACLQACLCMCLVPRPRLAVSTFAAAAVAEEPPSLCAAQAGLDPLSACFPPRDSWPDQGDTLTVPAPCLPDSRDAAGPQDQTVHLFPEYHMLTCPLNP